MNPEITTADIPSVLKRNLLAGNRNPVLLLAPYGIGKSYQSQQFADDNGFHYIDYRASQKTFNDVRGFGTPNYETRKMEFLQDEDFDFVSDKPNMIHFEEVLNAHSQVQKPLMQVMLDRRIGMYKLPEDTFIMASSNRLADKTGVERMLGALANRFAIYHVRPDMDSFMGYMSEHGKSAEVLSFLHVNSSAPYDYNIKNWDGESNFPTFRSFERLDEVASSYNTVGEMVSDRLLPAHASALIGSHYGNAFAQFVKLTASIGDVASMIDNAADIDIPAAPDLRWIIACRLVMMADKHNMDNVLLLANRLSEPDERVWQNRVSPTAMQTFVATSITQRNIELLQQSSALMKWHELFSEDLTRV